jgi:hypothetical protein
MHGKRIRRSALKQEAAANVGLGTLKKKAIKKVISKVGEKVGTNIVGKTAKNILGNPYLLPLAATVEGVKFMGTDTGKKLVDTQKKSDTIIEKHGGRSSSKTWGSSGPKY